MLCSGLRGGRPSVLAEVAGYVHAALVFRYTNGKKPKCGQTNRNPDIDKSNVFILKLYVMLGMSPVLPSPPPEIVINYTAI